MTATPPGTPNGAPLKISVVTPTFNRPELLRRTLASLRAQTYPHFSALICDNANDPATAAVVRDLADERFTYLPREQNLGMFANAMDGFRQATGDLVFKLDDDDLLTPEFFATLVVPFTERPDCTVAFSQIDLIDVNDELLPTQTAAMSRENHRDTLAPGYHQPFTDLAAGGAIQLAAALVRRDALDWDTIPEQVATAYDLYVLLQAARDGAAAHYSPQPLLQYRLHPGSDSANHLITQLGGAAHGLEDQLASGRHTQRDSLEFVLQDAKVRRARELLRSGRTGEARQDLRRALQLRRDPAAAKLLAASLLPTPVRDRILAARKERAVDETRLGAHD